MPIRPRSKFIDKFEWLSKMGPTPSWGEKERSIYNILWEEQVLLSHSIYGTTGQTHNDHERIKYLSQHDEGEWLALI